MKNTYQTLINSKTIYNYSPVERKLNYLKSRAEKLNLNLPLISLELHYKKGPNSVTETSNDKIYNNYLLENITGKFLCEDSEQIPFFESYGLKTSKFGEPQKLTNPGTGYTWTTQLYLVEK